VPPYPAASLSSFHTPPLPLMQNAVQNVPRFSYFPSFSLSFVVGFIHTVSENRSKHVQVPSSGVHCPLDFKRGPRPLAVGDFSLSPPNLSLPGGTCTFLFHPLKSTKSHHFPICVPKACLTSAKSLSTWFKGPFESPSENLYSCQELTDTLSALHSLFESIPPHPKNYT